MPFNSQLFEHIKQGDEASALSIVKPDDVLLFQSESKNYAIHLAAQKGMTKLVKILLDYGANPYELNNQNETALSLAHANDHFLTVAAIYKSDAKVTTAIGSFILDSVRKKDIRGLGAYCAKAGESVIKTIFSTYFSGVEKDSALHIAVRNNDAAMVQFLLEQGADPHYKNAQNKAAFEITTNAALLNIFKKMVKTEGLQTKQFSQLFEHIKQGDEASALSIVKPGDILLFLSESKNYAIHLAAQKGMTKLVKILLDYGANPYELNNQNETALSLAHTNDHFLTVAAIYKSDAKVTTAIGSFILDSVRKQDIRGLGAYCAKAGESVIKTILATYFSGVEKDSALHIAVRNNDEAMVQFLLEQGADPKYKNAQNKAAFEITTDAALLNIFKKMVKTELLSTKQEEVNKTTEEHSGTISKNYSNFNKFLLSKKYREEDFDSLGAIDHQSNEYYFQESPKSKSFAKEYLTAFWSDPKNINYTNKHHKDKFHIQSEKNADSKSMFPSCISFIVVTINKKEYCFVATSFDERDDFFHVLKEFTTHFNQSRPNSTEFILLSGRIAYFNDLVRSLLGEKYVIRGCAEKTFIKTLTKLFMEYGNNLFITGACNVFLYLYQKGAFYGNHKKAIDSTVRPPLPQMELIEIDPNRYAVLTVCCPYCQTNKRSMLHILKAGQEYNSEENNDQECNTKECNNEDFVKTQPKRSLSPVQNNIKTSSSFLQLEPKRNDSNNNRLLSQPWQSTAERPSYKKVSFMQNKSILASDNKKDGKTEKTTVKKEFQWRR